MSNNLGTWIDPDDCYNSLMAVISAGGGGDEPKYSPGFDPEQFSVKNITKSIDDLLI